MNSKALKKEHILRAGMEVMKSRGYNGTGVKEIVDLAGVPKGSFYNYFDSKEAFVLDALDLAGSSGVDSMRSALNRSLNPIDRLQALFVGFVDGVEESGFCEGCFLGNICQEMADTSESIRKKVRALLQEHIKIIAEVIEEGIQSRVINPDIEPVSAAEFIFNSWEGALMKMKGDKTREPLDAFTNNLRIFLKP